MVLAQWLLYFLIVQLFWSCQSGFNSYEPIPVEVELTEEPYDATPIIINGATIQVNALAQFNRISDITGNLETLPIPYAEFRITDSNGQIIQKGESDQNGNILALVPKKALSLTVSIHSRAFNDNYRASILQEPKKQLFYKVSQNLNLSGNETSSNIVNLMASTTQEMSGAAFNILYNIFVTNQYLRTQLGSNFKILHKARVFWKKGVSPATYLGASGALSFYSPNSSNDILEGLYILGGINGSLCVDTDHFDNSIIVHEYAHFLENKLGRTDSPGGSHSGNMIIDPRLAWSEGFANYFQAAVLGRDFYRDTTAIDCTSTQNLTNLNFILKNSTTPSENRDLPARPGEGNFRELAIARFLYALTSNYSKTASLTYGGENLPFTDIWSAFLNQSQSQFKGRSIHHFNRRLASTLDPTDWTTVTQTARAFDAEKQNATLTHWARPLVVSSTPCVESTEQGIDSNGYFTISSGAPRADRNASNIVISCSTNEGVAWSDMFNSNDFYTYTHSPTGTSLQIEYEASPSGSPYDLDLYIYKQNFVFLNSQDVVAHSARFYPEEGGSSGKENISLTSINSGSYFVNIRVDKPACTRADTKYRIRLNQSQYLCPGEGD